MNTIYSIFVSDLPKDTTDNDLQNFFKNYGYKSSYLWVNKQSIVSAKVFLENEECCTKARHELNGEIFKPENSQIGKPIRICKFEDNKNNIRDKNNKQSLLVKNISENMTQKEFYNLFLKYGDIESAKIEYDENGISKGYGYVYYNNEESAEEAKKQLNGKNFNGKILNVVNLITTKQSIITGKNHSLFVINFPKNFTDEDLKNLFEKYGKVMQANVVRDYNGESKGYGYVTFFSNEIANKCLNDIKENEICFPSLPNLSVKFASKKEDREKYNFYQINNEEVVKLQFILMYSTNKIQNEIDLEKEIRLFIKIIMLSEFIPKDVQVDFNYYIGFVVFSRKDSEIFLKKYNEYCENGQPSFMVIPFENKEDDFINENVNNNNNMIPVNNEYMNNNMPYNHMNNNQDDLYNNNAFNNNILINNNQFPPNNINVMMNNNNNNKSNNMTFNEDINSSFSQTSYRQYFQNLNSMNNSQTNLKNNMNNFNNSNNINKPGNIIPATSNNFYIPRGLTPQQYQMMLMNNKNRYQLLLQRQMMLLNNRNRFMNNNLMFNPSFSNQNNIFNYPFFNNNNMINNNINNKNNNDFSMKSDIKHIEQRNLEKLNYSDLQNQFNDSPRQIYNSDMINQNEEIANELADSIYEIVQQKYPNDASKITGMIREMGIEKMNNLMSKTDDLNSLIDQAYEMLKNQDHKQNNNNGN